MRLREPLSSSGPQADVARADRWPARTRTGSPRDHLPLHLHAALPHQGLPLAALPAARKTSAAAAAGRAAARQASLKAVFPWQIDPSRPPTDRPAATGGGPDDVQKYGQAVLTVHGEIPPAAGDQALQQAANGVARHLVNLFGAMPPRLRQTVTFDNGTEFARHLALHDLKIETFFCDPYAPWQKGGIENAIGRMRRFIPRKTDLATLSNSRFRNLWPPTTTPHASALTSGPRPDPLPNCCTSSVNPRPGLRRDDVGRGYASAISRRDFARVLQIPCLHPPNRGRRECRVRAAPAVSCGNVLGV